MLCLFVIYVLGMQTAVTTSSPVSDAPRPAVAKVSTTGLPALPTGRRTVLGGEIRNLDPVRDRFTLKIAGGRSVTILYDERTQVFRDGQPTPVLTLQSASHASVETTLDGEAVFALKIHTFSKLPQGSYRGQVKSFNSQTGELTLKPSTSEGVVNLRVPQGTPIVAGGADGEPSSTVGNAVSVVSGSVVEVWFTGGSGNTGIATQVHVLAAPGSVSVFSGQISSLNVRTGQLFIEDGKDHQIREIAFDPQHVAIPLQMHEGSAVKVTAQFDGSNYTATAIAIE